MGNKIKIALDLRRKKKDGTYPIVIEIRNKDKIRIATSYSALPENWNDGQFKKNESNYARKNLVLRSMYDKVERVLLEISEERRFISDKELRALINKDVSNKQDLSNRTFISVLDSFLDLKSNAGTRSVYEGTRNKILIFDKGCTFETIDRNWLSRFEKWMIDSGMKTNAYAIHLRNIRAVFNYAIDEEITTLYPFRKFKIRKEETRKRSLTVEQLRQLRNYPCEPYQERYRDMFMLMFYLIGVNAVDLFNAKKLVNGRLEYKRAKTGKLYSIKVEPEAMGIIEKYKGKKYLLNVLDEYGNYKDFLHRMGIGLKQIGECKRSGLGGKKHITPLFPDISSYWARHTWATIAASLDVPKETIAAALGHEIGMSVTSIYINFDMRKVDEANRLVLDKVKEETGV